MSQLTLDTPITDLTVGDLEKLIRKIVREETKRAIFIDEEGYLVFNNEGDYADYIDGQDKLPSEVKAYFIDEQGLKKRYSDYVPTPEYSKHLREIHRDIEEGKAEFVEHSQLRARLKV